MFCSIYIRACVEDVITREKVDGQDKAEQVVEMSAKCCLKKTCQQ